MHRTWQTAMAISAIAFAACADPASPPALPRPERPAQTQYPLAAEIAHLTNRGFIVPSLTVSINDHEARAEASLSYFANYVRLALTLDVLREYEILASRSTVPQEVSGLIPTPGFLQDALVIPVYQACDLAARGQVSGRSEIRALATGTYAIITLWASQAGREARAEQPDCPPPPPPGGGGGNPYDDQCQLCLEWTWYIGNEEVDSYWVCSVPTPCRAS